VQTVGHREAVVAPPHQVPGVSLDDTALDDAARETAVAAQSATAAAMSANASVDATRRDRRAGMWHSSERGRATMPQRRPR